MVQRSEGKAENFQASRRAETRTAGGISAAGPPESLKKCLKKYSVSMIYDSFILGLRFKFPQRGSPMGQSREVAAPSTLHALKYLIGYCSLDDQTLGTSAQ